MVSKEVFISFHNGHMISNSTYEGIGWNFLQAMLVQVKVTRTVCFGDVILDVIGLMSKITFHVFRKHAASASFNDFRESPS